MRIIDTPTPAHHYGSECPKHERVHSSHGWFVCLPEMTEVEAVRECATRLRKGEFSLDTAIANLLDALAGRYEEITESLPPRTPVPVDAVDGWVQAVAIAKVHVPWVFS